MLFFLPFDGIRSEAKGFERFHEASAVEKGDGCFAWRWSVVARRTKQKRMLVFVREDCGLDNYAAPILKDFAETSECAERVAQVAEQAEEKDDIKQAMLRGLEIEQAPFTHLHAAIEERNEHLDRTGRKRSIDRKHLARAAPFRLKTEQTIAATCVQHPLVAEIQLVHLAQYRRMRPGQIWISRGEYLGSDLDDVVPRVLIELSAQVSPARNSWRRFRRLPESVVTVGRFRRSA